MRISPYNSLPTRRVEPSSRSSTELGDTRRDSFRRDAERAIREAVTRLLRRRKEAGSEPARELTLVHNFTAAGSRVRKVGAKVGGRTATLVKADRQSCAHSCSTARRPILVSSPSEVRYERPGEIRVAGINNPGHGTSSKLGGGCSKSKINVLRASAALSFASSSADEIRTPAGRVNKNPGTDTGRDGPEESSRSAYRFDSDPRDSSETLTIGGGARKDAIPPPLILLSMLRLLTPPCGIAARRFGGECHKPGDRTSCACQPVRSPATFSLPLTPYIPSREPGNLGSLLGGLQVDYRA